MTWTTFELEFYVVQSLHSCEQFLVLLTAKTQIYPAHKLESLPELYIVVIFPHTLTTKPDE